MRRKKQFNSKQVQEKDWRKIFLFYGLIVIMMVTFVLMENNNNENDQRLRNDGFRTTALVTHVVRDDRLQDNRITHRVTFEYEAQGREIVNVRRRTNRRNVGEQHEIYYDYQDPYNFVFVEEPHEFGVLFWSLMVVFIGLAIGGTFIIKKQKD